MTNLILAYSSVNKVNQKLYFSAASLVILCVAVFYVWQINYMIKSTYLIKQYQKQIDNLSNENRNLEADFAKTSFMGTIGEKTQAMNFEKVSDVKYVQILEASAFLPKEGKNSN